MRKLLLSGILILLLLGCGDKGTSPGDTTPPARVEDLAILGAEGGNVTLTWTAPGDDGREGRASAYDVRYAQGTLSEASWDSAQAVVSPPLPKTAGEAETLLVKGIPSGTWAFGLKAADEVPNWSALSNVVQVTVPADTTPPARIEDLQVVEVGPRSVTLEWTAPGDDGMQGRAAGYELGFSEDSLAVASWSEIEVVGGLVAGEPGGRDWYEVRDLLPGRRYFFALRARDEAENWSDVSNVVVATTLQFVRLTWSDGPRGAAMGDWSPDGQTIAFDADWGPDGREQLYLMPASGGPASQLMLSPDGAMSPSWSPDGQLLAFVDLREEPDGRWFDLGLITPTPGSSPEILVRGNAAKQTISRPAWSPDGQRLAHVLVLHFSPPAPPQTEIRIVEVASGRWETLLAMDGMFSVAWSPDGETLWFDAGGPGEGNLWVIPVSGGQPVAMTTQAGDERLPVISPDGSRVAFAADWSGTYEVWTMGTDGSSLQRVSDLGKEYVWPTSWSPDGRAILVTFYEDRIYDVGILYVD
jgi:hypothetical protein